ncbi:MAG TPA: glycosyltransferase family 39 protein [Candidatus Acidoferrum sp.]|nr:glycosyltransferase family 39 protein [Candidatus Acidoferrum sp.]
MTDGATPASKDQRALSGADAPQSWRSRHSLALLAVLTLACLLPFSNKALHIDDPLFVWTARHIAQHPLDPYGFRVVWYATETPIADVTKNPPLASYYLALAGAIFGWSERALHVAMLLPALAVILGTYRLAQRFTRFPFLAATATLFAPGFLVSSTTLMCDVFMLALWILAVLLWLEGTAEKKRGKLAAAAILVTACAMTKYFGVALVPLLFAYSLRKNRRLDFTVAYLATPVLLLVLYQRWTQHLYGRGLWSDAVQYASLHGRGHELPIFVKLLIGLAFAGGCALPALFFAPLLWRLRPLLSVAVVSGFAALAISGHQHWFEAPLATAHWPSISAQMALLISGGVSLVGLCSWPAWSKRRRPEADAIEPSGTAWLDAGNLMLVLWVAGTFLFAAFVNWTINARSILPLIPAAAILLARRAETVRILGGSKFFWKAVVPLIASALVSLGAAWSDANLADAGRAAATQIHGELQSANAPVYFEGHWGFQYYMQQFGAQPADVRNSPFHAGDILVIPENTTNSFGPPPGFELDGKIIRFERKGFPVTMSQPLGAGFYASVWGPLPFAFGTAPAERYLIARLVPLPGNDTAAPMILKP